jgi:hypothetical protein
MRMWWLLMLPRELLYDVYSYGQQLWHYENLSLYRYVSENSAYELCADTRNFFIVYRIFPYE